MIRLLGIQSSRSKWLEIAEEEFIEKIKHHFKFEQILLPSSKKARDDFEKKKNDESESLLLKLKPSDYVILLDEKGKSVSSREWAESIQKLFVRSQPNITFIVGGAFGVSEKLKSRANESWSLSKLVFNHHVATLVVLEQIYRAGTILNNKPYHNE